MCPTGTGFRPSGPAFVMRVISIFALLAVPALLLIVFWAWMLIDCITRDYHDFGTLISSDKSLDKLLWVLLLIFTSVLGALAYYIAFRGRARARPDEEIRGNASKDTTQPTR